MKKIILFTVLLFAINLFHTNHSLAQNEKPTPWPPQIGQPYPDMSLIDQNGLPFTLADLKGNVIIIEPVGMNCPACQAFAGGHTFGAYQNNAVAQGMPSIRESFPVYTGGLLLPNKDIIFIQLLLYDMNMEAPKPEDAAEWASHFQFQSTKNEIVAVSTQDLRGQDSYNLVPGLQLIDKNFILRSDATGHSPRDDMYRTLLPMVPKILKEQIISPN